MTTTTTKNTGNGSSEWLNALEFYKNDIGILRNRLDEIVSKNNKTEVMAGAEHFQNQFVIQSENIDILSHKIRQNLHHLNVDVAKLAGHANASTSNEYKQINEEFDSLEKVIKELRHEFNLYLSKWL